MSKKEHAQHNEKVCKILHSSGECNDWVVTTAFYASLHYVQHEMFPLHDGVRNHDSFDSYYNCLKYSGKKPSRHEVTIDLVFDNLPDCGESYQFLFENCWTARYRRYKIPDNVSLKAMEELNYIKGALTK